MTDTRFSIAYKTRLGTCFQGKAEDVLTSDCLGSTKRRANLIFTSPPFPLNRKKKYGNATGQEYVDWLASFSSIFRSILSPSGSIVIEVGNAWEPGRPVMSTLALQALLAFQERGLLNLCQQFIWYNTAKLPSPAQWVTIERIRVKDAFTHIWWLSPSERPKASNRRVLTEYKPAMRRLLATKKYNAGRRPSEHHISEKSFFTDNRGAIPSNVIAVSNTRANSEYLDYCRKHGLQPHPARMPIEVAEFFIKLLTNRGDLVIDPFGGSNTTGAAAERLGRRWIAIEPTPDYIEGSKGWFVGKLLPKSIELE